jgi:chaperonin GroEL
MRLDQGMLSHAFANDPDGTQAVLSEAYVFLCDSTFHVASEIEPVCKRLTRLVGQRPVLLIAQDIGDAALEVMVQRNQQELLNVVAVKAPGFGQRRSQNLQDIAILTGGTVLPDAEPRTLSALKIGALGRCRSVLCTPYETILMDARGNANVLQNRIDEIQKAIAIETSEYDREKLTERLQRLSGGVALLRVGGLSEADIAARIDIVKDMIFAVFEAAESGVVSGNGIALIEAATALDDIDLPTADGNRAVQMVRNALEAPFKSILAGAGQDSNAILRELRARQKKRSGSHFGYDVRSGIFVDSVKSGILTPVGTLTRTLASAVNIVTHTLKNLEEPS